jgi:hypothetical protein
MRLIPVNFGQAQRTIHQTDACDSLALAPSALPVLPAETCSLSYPAPAGNRFLVEPSAPVAYRACYLPPCTALEDTALTCLELFEQSVIFSV